MEMMVRPEFVRILEEFQLTETQFFPASKEISHKFLYLLQPEIFWDNTNPNEFTILKCLLNLSVFDEMKNRHTEYHLQIGHPLTVHFYQGLNLIEHLPNVFEVFIEEFLQNYGFQEKSKSQDHEIGDLMSINSAEI